MRYKNIDKLRQAQRSPNGDNDPELSGRQIDVLVELASNRNASTKDLSEVLSIPKPAITRILDRLEELKFCERKKSPDDLRLIVVTPKYRGISYLERLDERLGQCL